jgi:toxin ParE1/3/4
LRKASVVLRAEAEADLFAIHGHIAREVSARIAEAYVDRITNACLALSTFPRRGTRREDLTPGLRTIGFERRATIAFLVEDDLVTIVRVFYGGQDVEGSFSA